MPVNWQSNFFKHITGLILRKLLIAFGNLLYQQLHYLTFTLFGILMSPKRNQIYKELLEFYLIFTINTNYVSLLGMWCMRIKHNHLIAELNNVSHGTNNILQHVYHDKYAATTGGKEDTNGRVSTIS